MASSINKRDPRFWNKNNKHLFGDITNEEESNYVFNIIQYNIEKNSPLCVNDNEVEDNRNGHQYISDKITSLPSAYDWSTININEDLEELRMFLSENYLEAEGIYRYDLSTSHIRWILMFPNCSNGIYLGIRQKENQKLVGFISATPSNITIHHKPLHTGFINLLCVRKDKRYKNFVPLLVQEIRRRLGTSTPIVPTALHTLERPLGHFPLTTSKCYHKSLNFVKLLDIGWITTINEDLSSYNSSSSHDNYSISSNTDSSRGKIDDHFSNQVLEKYLRLDGTTSNGVVNEAYSLWKRHVSQGKLYQNFSFEEFTHTFIFNSDSTSNDEMEKKVISTYYLCNEAGEVTDLTSFYHIPMTLLNCNNGIKKHNHSQLFMAFSFVHIANTVSIIDLMKSTLLLAQNKHQVDVFTTTDIANHSKFLQALQFDEGSAEMNYYVYNWKYNSMKPEEVYITLP